MKLYQVKWKESISEVESERQTDKSVFIGKNRYNWICDYNAFFLTYSEAKSYLINHWESEVKEAKRRLENKESKLSKIISLCP